MQNVSLGTCFSLLFLDSLLAVLCLCLQTPSCSHSAAAAYEPVHAFLPFFFFFFFFNVIFIERS